MKEEKMKADLSAEELDFSEMEELEGGSLKHNGCTIANGQCGGEGSGCGICNGKCNVQTTTESDDTSVKP